MPVNVADASVIAAIVFREPEAQQALRLVRGNEIHAPWLLMFELASVARKKAAVADLSQRDVLLRGLQRSHRLPIHRDDVDHIEVVRLALRASLSTYDASYLHLALSLGAPLLTFDRRLRQAAEALGHAVPRA